MNRVLRDRDRDDRLMLTHSLLTMLVVCQKHKAYKRGKRRVIYRIVQLLYNLPP